MVTALLVVDVQRVLVEGEHAVPDALTFLERLTQLLEDARARAVPVIHLQDDGVQGRLIHKGSPGWELALPPAPGEPVVQKAADDGFEGTPLADLLAERAVDRVIVAGIQSEMCVAATARGALQRGLSVVLPRGAHTTYDVPATERDPGVPAQLVSRVAVWSLGDDVEVVDLDDVRW